MSGRHHALGLAVAGGLALAACNGAIVYPKNDGSTGAGAGTGSSTDPGNGSSTGTGATGGSGMINYPPAAPAQGVNPPGAKVRCDSEPLIPRVLRRLTNVELEATLRSVFQLDATAWAGPSFLPDPASEDGFNNNSQRLTVGDEYAERLLESAKDIATVVSDAGHLPQLLPCAATGGDDCAGQFIDTFGQRLYRRPLSQTERNRYLALYTKVTAQNDFPTFVYWATVAMIKSPNTVYRSEIGASASGKYALTPYEVASELSYVYTGAPPSDDLLALAAANRLATADDVEAAARTLVIGADGQPTDAFRATVLRFADQWLKLSTLDNISKDTTAFPDFVPEVQTSAGNEIKQYLSSVIFTDKGKPADLYTAPYTFVDQTLSQYYGWGQATGADFVKTTRPDGWGIGLLPQGSLMAVEAGSLSTSPTKRGHIVRDRVLCYQVPPPPPTVGKLPDPTSANTTRERYEKVHLADDSCKACHQLMDPIGFGFEHLDASGRFRDTENGFPIDDSGSLKSTSAGDIAFKGSTELATALAKLPEASDCLADFISGYSFGMDHAASGCVAKTATEELRTGQIGVLDYYVRMARAESFRTRTP